MLGTQVMVAPKPYKGAGKEGQGPFSVDNLVLEEGHHTESVGSPFVGPLANRQTVEALIGVANGYGTFAILATVFGGNCRKQQNIPP